ncbi:hypothetical protein EDD21DRAFT_428078 [Dissophora ornata]|nr:hypothetical protein EDD21DRAFT_428078 [Dissophora ornata]
MVKLLVSFCMLAGLLSCSLQPSGALDLTPSPEIHKRDNIVYVTVTEYRYVPFPAPATAFAPATTNQPAPQVQVVHHSVLVPAPSILVVAVDPSPALTASPTAATWQLPPNNALTFTSYAGLLSTVAPAFYPSPSPLINTAPVTIPASAITLASPPGVASSARAPVPSAVPMAWPTPTSLPVESVASHYPTTASSSTTWSDTRDQATTMSGEVHTPPSAVTTVSSSTDSPDLSSISDQKTTPSTTTSTDATVSTTTTTQGDTTQTTTSVGSDGTTTVLTMYPTSTRSRVSTSTSGAHPRGSRGQLLSRPSAQSAFGHLIDLFVSDVGFSVAAIAMTGAMVLPGVMFLVA